MLGIMKSAIPVLIIPLRYSLERAIIPSYCSHLITFLLLNYFLTALNGRMCPSYPAIHMACLVLITTLGVGSNDKIADGSSDDQPKDYVERLGGNGPKVAAYLRKSVKGQSQFSIGGQIDEINAMKEKIKPSVIYWFFDDGKSSKSEKDFDKLKINDILNMRRAADVDELWVAIFDRMGRVSRRLAHLYLEFTETGGLFRTPERVYGRDDLVDFVSDADEAEKANRIRVKHVRNGTIRSFKLKHWNIRGEPIGYMRKGKWLEKRPEFDPWIKKAIVIFHEIKCLETVCDQLGTFGGLLAKPLNTKQLRHLLSDLLYTGNPERFGVAVPDEALFFYDEKTRRKNLEILGEIKQKWKPKRIGPIERLAIYKPATCLQLLLEVWESHHRNCGGLIRKTGTTQDHGIWQQLCSCKKCHDGWRVPTKNNDFSRNLGAKSGTENYMGALNFESALSTTQSHGKKKDKLSSVSVREKTVKSEMPVDQLKSQTFENDFQGHPVTSRDHPGKQDFQNHAEKNINQIAGNQENSDVPDQVKRETPKFSAEFDKNKSLEDFI